MKIGAWDRPQARSVFSAMSSPRPLAGRAPQYEHEASPDKIPQWIVLPTATIVSLAGWAAAAYVLHSVAHLISQL